MLHIYFGNEPYLIDKAIEEHIQGVSMKEMNVSYVNSVADISELIGTVPFMDSKRVIIASVETITDDLSDYKIMPDFVELIILPMEVDKRKKSYTSLKPFCTEFKKLPDDKLKLFIIKYLKNNGGLINENAYLHLQDRIDYLNSEDVNLYTIEVYLRQLLYLGNVITEEGVDRIVPPSCNEEIFELSKYLTSGDVQKTLLLGQRYIERGEQSIAMLSLLLYPFRLGYKVSLYSEDDRKEALSAIGVTEYQIRTVLRYDDKTLSHAIDIIQDGISGIKKGRGNNMFNLTLAKLCMLLGPSNRNDEREEVSVRA